MGEFPNKKTQFSKDNQPAPGRNGRPKGKSFKTILEELLELEANEEDLKDEDIKKIFSGSNHKITNREILMARLLIQAKRDGDSKSMERLMNRVEGKPAETITQKIELDTDSKITISKEGEEIKLSTKKESDENELPT